MSVTATIIVQIIMILINALFAGTEIAVVSLNSAKIKKEAEEGDRKAAKLLKMIDNPSGFLSTIQIAITLAGFLGAAFSADVLSEHLVSLFMKAGWHGPYSLMNTVSVVLITIIISFFTLIFGELVPKRIAQQKTELWAKAAVGILSSLALFMKPVIWLLSSCTNLVLRILHLKTDGGDDEVTEEDIRLMVESSGDAGKIEEDEQEWIQNVFDFNDIAVDDVMTREADVVALQEDTPERDILALIKETGFSRFPVYGENINDIKGTIIAKEFLLNLTDKERKPFKNLIREPYLVPDSIHADKLFSDMQEKKIHMAIVIDEYGQFAGIITLEDLLEEIVGNIYDEFDSEEQEDIVEIDENTWKVSGDTTIEDFNDFTEVYDIPENEDYDTIGGLILSTLSTIPEDGTQLDLERDGFSFHVTKIEDRRIVEVIVKKVISEDGNKKADE